MEKSGYHPLRRLLPTGAARPRRGDAIPLLPAGETARVQLILAPRRQKMVSQCSYSFLRIKQKLIKQGWTPKSALKYREGGCTSCCLFFMWPVGLISSLLLISGNHNRSESSSKSSNSSSPSVKPRVGRRKRKWFKHCVSLFLKQLKNKYTSELSQTLGHSCHQCLLCKHVGAIF